MQMVLEKWSYDNSCLAMSLARNVSVFAFSILCVWLQNLLYKTVVRH